MKFLTIAAAASLLLAACSREDYLSATEAAVLPGVELFQTSDRDVFITRSPDGSVHLYDVELFGGETKVSVDSRVTVFGPLKKSIDEVEKP